MKAINTRYNGAEFRSRLEARWAAFFDLCGWRWTFEPFDLDGWIPDFALHTSKDDIACLVEVKPFSASELRSPELRLRPEIQKAYRHSVAVDAPEWPEIDPAFQTMPKLEEAASEAEYVARQQEWDRYHANHWDQYEKARAEHCRQRHEVLVCGLGPFRGDLYGAWSIGTLFTIDGPDVTCVGKTYTLPEGRVDFSVEYGYWGGRIYSDYQKLPHGVGDQSYLDLDFIWRRAGNLVKWLPDVARA